VPLRNYSHWHSGTERSSAAGIPSSSIWSYHGCTRQPPLAASAQKDYFQDRRADLSSSPWRCSAVATAVHTDRRHPVSTKTAVFFIRRSTRWLLLPDCLLLVVTIFNLYTRAVQLTNNRKSYVVDLLIFARGLHTPTAVAHLSLRQLGILVIMYIISGLCCRLATLWQFDAIDLPHCWRSTPHNPTLGLRRCVCWRSYIGPGVRGLPGDEGQSIHHVDNFWRRKNVLH